ncbi:hypothetical protein B7463_g11746, partial [Scytalidium lignicola]
MATCPVRFEFHCENAPEKLKFIHNVPRSFVTSDAQTAQRDPGYANRFATMLQPIMKEHEAACLAASNPRCGNCGSPTMKTVQTPMSWLHIVNDPFVNVWVNPICGKGECEIKTRQQIQSMMAIIAGEGQSQGASAPGTTVEIMSCNVCGKTEGIKRCAQCKAVAYCGREHQKADWKAHKKICRPSQ